MRGGVLRLGFTLIVAALFLGRPGASASDETENARLLDILVRSYPDYLAGHDGNALIWKDGTRMVFDDGRRDKDFETLLDKPSLRDMFYSPYKVGPMTSPPDVNIDPGRVRFEPFFFKMYGDCRKKETAKDLVDVVWLPKKWGKKLRVTRVNGVAEALSRVSAELDALPGKFNSQLYPPAGTYNCRVIAGTGRVSAHGTGTAIDIATKHAHYWRWTRPDKAGHYRWRNAIDMTIVEIFEKHGFIWGGKWYHYDTMHFEYRPELIEAGRQMR